MSRYFDPYTFDYKTYMKETYGLTEMPVRLSQMQLDVDAIDNGYFALEAEKKGKMIKSFNHGNENLRVFEYIEKNKTWISLLSEKKPILAGEHVYQRIQTPIKGIVNLQIWNYKWYHRLIWHWFEEEIIPHEPTIISDKAQTDFGFNFWKQLFDEYVSEKKTHKMSVVDFRDGSVIKEISNKKEMDEYFKSQKTENFRFVLQRI